MTIKSRCDVSKIGYQNLKANLDILIVDDDDDAVEEYTGYIRALFKKANIITKATAETARSFLKGHKPDIILMEVMLPMGSGLTIISQMCTLSDPPRIIVNSDMDSQTLIHSIRTINDTHMAVEVLPHKIRTRVDALRAFKPAPPPVPHGHPVT
jgi:DNA-binding response OmpR family regulator